MEEQYICTLVGFTCPQKSADGTACESGNTKCGFIKSKNDIIQEKRYVRKERWYKKYYK